MEKKTNQERIAFGQLAKKIAVAEETTGGQGFTLTGGQLGALQWLLDSSDDFLVLSGSAGTGKTTVMAEYCRRNAGTLLTAPTHKAVKVLVEKSGYSNAQTIHSYLKMKRKFTGDRYEFVFDPAEKFDYYPAIVIDEASMLDEQLLEAIILVANRNQSKVVFVGDEKQLNPVNHDHSPVFHAGFQTHELTEIIRHQNDIIDLSRNLDWLYTKVDGQHFRWQDPNDGPLDLLLKSNGTNYAKFITWTNRMVSAVNDAMRGLIYHDPAQFEPGETLLMNAHFVDPNPLSEDVLYVNNEEVKVDSVEAHIVFGRTHNMPNREMPAWKINDDLICLDLQSSKQHEQNLEWLRKRALMKVASWKDFYDYKEQFAEYQYNHAITVHKSQGSTYENSIVNISEIMRNPNEIERTRMLYTAITRASEMNYFL